MYLKNQLFIVNRIGGSISNGSNCLKHLRLAQCGCYTQTHQSFDTR